VRRGVAAGSYRAPAGSYRSSTAVVEVLHSRVVADPEWGVPKSPPSETSAPALAGE